jgi:VanZ family protein
LKPANRFLIPAITWLIISTILLTLPGSAFPQEDWLSKIWFDKWVHIGMFSIMVTLICWGIYKKNVSPGARSRNFILVAVLCLCYGIAMEFVQKYFIPNRSFDVGDILADAVGCSLGLIFSLRRYQKK